MAAVCSAGAANSFTPTVLTVWPSPVLGTAGSVGGCSVECRHSQFFHAHCADGPPRCWVLQGLWEAVAAVRGAGKRAVVATPRVLKPNEEPLVGS